MDKSCTSLPSPTPVREQAGFNSSWVNNEKGLLSSQPPFSKSHILTSLKGNFSTQSPQTQREWVEREGWQPAGQVRYVTLGGAPQGVPEPWSQHAPTAPDLAPWRSGSVHRLPGSQEASHRQGGRTKAEKLWPGMLCETSNPMAKPVTRVP